MKYRKRKHDDAHSPAFVRSNVSGSVCAKLVPHDYTDLAKRTAYILGTSSGAQQALDRQAQLFAKGICVPIYLANGAWLVPDGAPDDAHH